MGKNGVIGLVPKMQDAFKMLIVSFLFNTSGDTSIDNLASEKAKHEDMFMPLLFPITKIRSP